MPEQRNELSAATVYFEVVHDDGEALEVVTREEYDRLRDAARDLRTAGVDWRAAWEASVKVGVAADRFIEAEREGNARLIEDAHFGLLKALADYQCGRPRTSPLATRGKP